MGEEETAHVKAHGWWKFDSVEEMWSHGVAVCTPGRGLQRPRVKEEGGRGKIAICGLPTGLLGCARADVTHEAQAGMRGAARNGGGGATHYLMWECGVRLVPLKQHSCLLGHG